MMGYCKVRLIPSWLTLRNSAQGLKRRRRSKAVEALLYMLVEIEAGKKAVEEGMIEIAVKEKAVEDGLAALEAEKEAIKSRGTK